ncbi:MAG: hypothetical protein RL490_2417, partial [Pseudomonadota bacterium]
MSLLKHVCIASLLALAVPLHAAD